MSDESVPEKDAGQKKMNVPDEVIVEDEFTPDPPKPEPTPPAPPTPPLPPATGSNGGLVVWLVLLTLGLIGAYAATFVLKTDDDTLKNDLRDALRQDWNSDINLAVKDLRPTPMSDIRKLIDAKMTGELALKKELAAIRLDLEKRPNSEAIDRIETRLTQLNERLENIKSDTAGRFTALNDHVTSSRTDLDAVMEKLNTLAKTIQAMDEDQQKQWESIRSLDTAGDTQKLAAELTALKTLQETQSRALTDIKASLEDEIKKLEKTVGEMDKATREIIYPKSDLKKWIADTETQVARLKSTLEMIKPLKIIQPLDGMTTGERFIVIEAALVMPEIQDIREGKVIIKSEDSGQERMTNVEFKNGKTKTTELLGSGVNIITVQATKDDKIYSDTIQVTSTAKPSEMRIILNWVGNCDLDLFVTDPTGKMCFYNERKLPSGALLDRDDRRLGIDPPGPETFLLSTEEGHKLVTGTYKIEVYGFEMRSRDGRKVKQISPPVKAHVTVILHEDDPTRTKIQEYTVDVNTTEKRYPVANVELTK